MLKSVVTFFAMNLPSKRITHRVYFVDAMHCCILYVEIK